MGYELIKEMKGAYIAPTAQVMGSVRIGERSSVWYGTVIRGDESPIEIGKGSNVQDNCVVHSNPGGKCVIGDHVTVGHGCIIHGCSIGDETLVGMGAIIMDGAVIGKHCVIAAGALVTGGMQIPEGSMVMGSPAKIRRQLTEEEMARNMEYAEHYMKDAKRHFAK